MIYETLYRELGPQHWWPGETDFEVIVGAVLTQNTAWSNVEKAIENLKQADVLSLEKMRKLSLRRLAVLIRPSGYFNLKAKRLKAVLNWLWNRTRGRLSTLKKVKKEILRDELLSVYGVGPETADSILLYAIDKKSFVVDAYTRRIFSRHGFLRGHEAYHQVKDFFESGVHRSRKIYNEFHAMIVNIGKNYCRTIPKCEFCPLKADLIKVTAPGFSYPLNLCI